MRRVKDKLDPMHTAGIPCIPAILVHVLKLYRNGIKICKIEHQGASESLVIQPAPKVSGGRTCNNRDTRLEPSLKGNP